MGLCRVSAAADQRSPILSAICKVPSSSANPSLACAALSQAPARRAKNGAAMRTFRLTFEKRHKHTSKATRWPRPMEGSEDVGPQARPGRNILRWSDRGYSDPPSAQPCSGAIAGSIEAIEGQRTAAYTVRLGIRRDAGNCHSTARVLGVGVTARRDGSIGHRVPRSSPTAIVLEVVPAGCWGCP
jgi:hypothetical protein